MLTLDRLEQVIGEDDKVIMGDKRGPFEDFWRSASGREVEITAKGGSDGFARAGKDLIKRQAGDQEGRFSRNFMLSGSREVIKRGDGDQLAACDLADHSAASVGPVAKGGSQLR